MKNWIGDIIGGICLFLIFFGVMFLPLVLP